LKFSLAAFAAQVSVVDDQDVVVTFDKPPRRAVSLPTPPSLTESVYTLDKYGALVGVDRFSNWFLIFDSHDH
jgi:ABC-type hemin transport system substrate-binding protein